MRQLEKELLSNPGYIKTHRSYIINMEHISTVSQREIIMQSHAVVPLAKTSYRTVKSAYITFAFEETK